jgi:hypothetical protein
MQIYHYHPETGEYIGTGTADVSPLEPGVWLVPANATQVIPPLPTAGKVRRWTGTVWALVDAPAQPLDPEYTPSFAELVAAKMDRINEAKNVALDGGFMHDGTLFDSDTKARLAYLELALKLGQDATYSTPWKASAGQWVTMDGALFVALQPAYEAHIQACFAWQATREAEVAAAVALAEADEAAARVALEGVAETMGQES